MIRVLIADDHTIVREGLKQILLETDDIIPADEAGNGHEVLEKVAANNLDLVLLDISMPGMNGLDVLKQLKLSKPDLTVLVLSMHPEEQYAVRLLKAGAAGYLTKDNAPDELINAIRRVSEGRKYISPSLAEKLAIILETGSEKLPHEMLSDREHQIIIQIAEGRTLKQIAKELSLSIKTVSTYRTRAMNKMNMKSNSEIMHYVIKNKLAD
jgi:DNA-binding NarL/FixJ family response regulator